MTRDWKTLARALALDIPDPDLDKITPALDALETSFRPLAANVPHLVEPAVVFFCSTQEAE
ncbi:MAG: hypothetical protein Q8N47_08980 [Bryobacterales bacterium]|nr:hypothetical protein [Bryobacterales bacterium]